MVITQPTGYDQVADNPEGNNNTFDFSREPEVIRDNERYPRKLTGVARNLMPETSQLKESPAGDSERIAQLTHEIRGNGDVVCSARTATLADVSSFRLPA